MDFEQYVAQRGRALERYAYVLCGDLHRSEDLVQTALLAAYRRWRRITRADHPDVYVRRVVTTAWIDHVRRRSSGEVAVAAVPDSPDPGADPAERVADRDALRRGLATLSPAQRAVLVLRHLDGYDDDAIARVLGCSAGTVRSHASRGLQRLREAMSPATGETAGTPTGQVTGERALSRREGEDG